MEPIDPCINPQRVPEGSRPVLVADKQPEYATLPSVVTPAGTVVTRWQPTEEERERIAAGEDVWLTVMTFGQPLQPLMMTVGPPERIDR